MMAPPAPTADGELDDGSPNSKAARKKKTPVAVKDDKYADLLYPKPAPKSVSPNLYRPIFTTNLRQFFVTRLCPNRTRTDFLPPISSHC